MDDQWPHWATHLFNQGAAILTAQQTLFLQGRQILEGQDEIFKNLKELQMTDAELKTLLAGVDATTNASAQNIVKIAAAQTAQTAATQEISDDLDRLIAGGITPESVAKLQEIADRAQAIATASGTTADAAEAQVATLQAVAAKSNPTVPPPPPPVDLPPLEKRRK